MLEKRRRKSNGSSFPGCGDYMVSGTTAFNDILQPGVLKIFMSTFIHLLKSSRVRR